MRARIFCPLLPLVLSACGPGASTSVVGKPTAPTAPVRPAAPVESPARWALHATRLGNLRARLDLGSGVLYGGDGGERWLDKRDGTPPVPATMLLPEPIVGIAKSGKGVLLVGASGTVHTASEPLGAVESKKAPPAPLRSPSAGRAAIVAIADGGLMRTTDGGGSWSKLDLPGLGGTLVQVAMNEGGLGIALAAPQRAWATDDDGATWKPMPTPGVGARRVVHDVNGDLMLEGVEASGLLRASPLRLERVARAPKSDGFDLAVAPTAAIPSYARAVQRGRGAMIGDRYLEAISEADDPTRWRLAYGKLGAPLEAKKVTELNGCEHVWVGGDAISLYAACDDRGTGMTKAVISSGKPPPPKPSSNVSVIRVYRSDDEGKTWKEDGNTGSRRAENGHVWLAPDRALIIDGACKRLRSNECYSSPPLIRPVGQKSFAKLGLPGHVETVASMAFAGTRAYALGRAGAGPLSLLVSANGRDFTKIALPALPSSDTKQTPLSAAHAQPGTVSVDPSGVVVATASIAGDWVVYSAKEDGSAAEGHRFPHHADALSMAGKRGFAWSREGRGWETSDAGVTWTQVAAPAFPDLPLLERTMVCNAYGCLLGDRAARVGWGAAATTTKVDAAAPKIVARPSLACTAEGEWKSLGQTLAAPTAYDAEVASGTRWLAIRHDVNKGSVSVVLGKHGAKGVETKDVSLFGPSTKDVATAVLPQIEGAAAIRFAFKREATAKVDPKEKDPKKKVAAVGAIVDGQKVDVEVAWFVASTGVVHRATIKAAGPLDPRDVIGGFKEGAAAANPGLLSIAQGGVHVRPFATKPDVPLWFVREGGKVDRLPWPELPSKDVGGGQLALRIDAVRAAGRSVILGVSGAQLLMAWANEAGTGWETRTWGLWPDLKTTVEPSWDFSYVAASGGTRPAIVVQWPGAPGLPPVSWGVPLKGVEADPSEVLGMPTQKTLAEPEVACGDKESAPRVVVPFSVGTRHPITITGEPGEPLLATSHAVLRGDGKTACVLAYEARAIAKGKSTDKVAKADPEGALSALIPWADRDHAYLFKSAINGETSVRSMKCSPGGGVPAALSGVEGFEER